MGAWQPEQNASELVASMPVLKAPQKRIPPANPRPSKTPAAALLGVDSFFQKDIISCFI
jgi:hypothetical protein